MDGYILTLIGLCCFQVTPGIPGPTRPVEPCRQLRPNEANNRREFGHFDGGGTCSDAFTTSPHAATMSLVNHSPVQECPVLRTENRESQEYVTFHSCRALLVRFHRGLRGSHSFSPELFDPSIDPESVAERLLSVIRRLNTSSSWI